MKFDTFKNVLVLAPHTDDGELGAGATINKIIRGGGTVTYVAFSIARQSVPLGHSEDILKSEVADAVKKLGIKQSNLIIHDFPVRKLNFHRQEILEILVSLRNGCDYDLVLTPSTTDVHQDHQTVTNEVIRAFKGRTILGYELIWNNLVFHTQAFMEIEEEDLVSKIHSLRCYVSQRERSYFDPHFIKSLAVTRGTQVGTQLAECFEVIRLKIG